MGRTTGASVLPVSTLRLAPGKFEVAIGAPIEVPDDAEGKPDYAAAVQAYADWVTPFRAARSGTMARLEIHRHRSLSAQLRLDASIRDRAVREGIAVMARQRVTPGLVQRRFDVARLEGEGKRAAGVSNGPLRLLRKRRSRAKGVAIAPLPAATVLLDKVTGQPDLFKLALRRKPDRHLMAVAVRANAHAGVAESAEPLSSR